MLAAREAVQDSTGFSPNELVFGHTVQGPLAMLKDNWLDAELLKNLIDFVNGFRHRLCVAGGMAREKLQVSQSRKRKKNYDRRTECQEFSLGDQVLALMPIMGSPFQTKYTSPYTVIEKISDLNYLIVTPGRKKSRQLCHVNLLKSYYIRGIELSHAVDDGVRPAPVRPALVASLLAVTHVDGVPEPDDSLLYGRLKYSESLCNLVKLLAHLPESKRGELSELVRKYPCLFGDVPSRTDWVEHNIDVGGAQAIKQRFYHVTRDT